MLATHSSQASWDDEFMRSLANESPRDYGRRIATHCSYVVSSQNLPLVHAGHLAFRLSLTTQLEGFLYSSMFFLNFLLHKCDAL